MRETIQNTNGKQFHAVSLSGGKDSTAMLLLMIEQDMPIDMVLSADTGMEFPEMYEHLAKLDEHLFRERGIHITLWIVYMLIPAIGTILGVAVMSLYKLRDKDAALMAKCNAGEISRAECEAQLSRKY